MDKVLLAIEKYRTGAASLGHALELAGLSIEEMMTVLINFGVPNRLEKEDYLESVEDLRRVFQDASLDENLLPSL